MRIAILGTRGIPNNYGGFEQCAQKIALHLIAQSHDVTVYSPRDHFYQKNTWNSINVRHIFSNEKKLKSLSTFIYDFLCLLDAVKNDFNVILELGYAPNSVFYFLVKKKNIITNMDGIDWKRDKWGMLSKTFIKLCEKLAMKKSKALIADNPAMEKYLKCKYGARPIFYIPYGADLFENPDISVLKEYGVEKNKYYIMIARLEPENNIEMVLKGYIMTNAKEPFLVVGGREGMYGKKLLKHFGMFRHIKFLGGVYDYKILSTLRWYSKIYFHGHSVGGTNPSLLEAMASNTFIVAHYNDFNKSILGEDAYYFRNSQDVAKLIKDYKNIVTDDFLQRNRRKIEKYYSWKGISEKYLDLFKIVNKQGHFH